MKLINIIENSLGIDEQAGMKRLFQGLTSDKIDDLVSGISKGTLSKTAYGDLVTGLLKTKGISDDYIRMIAKDWVEDSRFIANYAKRGDKLTKNVLLSKGYSQTAAAEILKAAKESKKFQNALKGVTKTGGKTGTKTGAGTTQGIRKMYNDLKKFLSANPNIEVDFLKCILIPLGDDEGVKIESDSDGNPVLYYTKGSSYDDQGGLIFRVDGSVETGDGSKKGTWSCNTSGLDIQEQIAPLLKSVSTGSEITSKQLSIAMEDLNDNLSGDLLDGDSTDMMDALNIVKGIEGKTYKSSTAIKTLIHNYPKVYKTSLVDDINNLSNLDFEGMERKEELLGILGLSSGESSGGNQSGDSDAKGDSDVKGDGNTSTGISHITIKWGSGKTTPVVGKVKYVQCKDLPFKYGCISDKIKTIQKCLPAELKVDGYYGPKTSNALWNLYQGKEKSDITKSVYDKIMVACEKKDEKTKSTEPRKKVVPPIKLEPKGLAPLKVYDTESVIAKIDPAVMAANIRKTIDGRRVDQIISDELKYSFGRYVLKIDDRLTEKQLEMVNLYMATQGFKVLRKRTETPDGSKYVWKPDSKDAKRIARKERSIKKDQDKINDIKNKDNE